MSINAQTSTEQMPVTEGRMLVSVCLLDFVFLFDVEIFGINALLSRNDNI